MEFGDQILEKLSGPIFERQHRPDGRFHVEPPLQGQVHQHGNHSFQGLVKIVKFVLNHRVKNTKQLVLYCHIPELGLLKNGQRLGLNKFDHMW